MSKEKPPNKLQTKQPTVVTPTNFSVVANTIERPDGVVATQATGSLHIGPLPSPDTLKAYQDISPKILDGILEAFVKQGANRRSNESWIYKGGVIRAQLGQIFAFLITIYAFYQGINLIREGFGVWASLLVGSVLVSLVVAFLSARSGKNRDESPEDNGDSPAQSDT